MQLVKANVDFPNIIYLVLAQKSVVDTSERGCFHSPYAYLEKIIQVSFDVPVVNRKHLQDAFLQALNDLLAGPDLNKLLLERLLEFCLSASILAFRNLRDLNRFLARRRSILSCSETVMPSKSVRWTL